MAGFGIFFKKNWPEIGSRCLEILFLCLRDGLALRSLDLDKFCSNVQLIAYYVPFNLSTGPELPYSIRYISGAMAPSPDGNGVILIGGIGNNYDSILELKVDGLELKADGQGWVGSWTTLSTKLQYARSNHVVIPVWMDPNIVCGLNGIISANAGKYHISLFVSKY